jgi:transcriptional regulator with XRE-family HTH domain
MDRTELLKQLITDTGLSMRAFAEKAGIPNTTLHSMLERGMGNTSVDNVIKVCKALGITVDQLEKMAMDGSTESANSQFSTPQEAMEFILKQPSIMGFGGFDINKMTDEEIMDFANELLRQLQLLSYKYKK